jgi:hypothetical protein
MLIFNNATLSDLCESLAILESPGQPWTTIVVQTTPEFYPVKSTPILTPIPTSKGTYVVPGGERERLCTTFGTNNQIVSPYKKILVTLLEIVVTQFPDGALHTLVAGSTNSADKWVC